MRNLLLFAFIVFPSLLKAQYSLPLNFSSYASKLSVAKDESLSLVNRSGEVGTTQSIKTKWQRVDAPRKNSISGATLDQSNFFNKDTGFVSGFISQKETGEFNIIYHTTNGGQNWKAIDFGQDGWVDDATHLDDGEAWLSVGGSGIAYTKDYGLSWEKLKIPEIKQRFAKIYFNNKRQGIIGSLWNMIAYTPNNCKDWQILPTPLDQKKYNKTNSESRPEIEAVAIFDNYFLVKQEEFVFYSRRDSIDWQWMTSYVDFFTDPYNSGLFFRSKKGEIVRVGDTFTPVFTFSTTPQYYDAKCRNGSLFIVNSTQMTQLTNHNKSISVSFPTTSATFGEPIALGYSNGKTLGIQENKIFIQSGFERPWKYSFTFPYPLDSASLSVTEEGTLLYETSDELFYLDLHGKERKKVKKKEMITAFQKSEIQKIIFSSGTQGCFHMRENKLEYILQGDLFERMADDNTDKKYSIPKSKINIEHTIVKRFNEQLHALFEGNMEVSLEDVAFSEAEYQQCKKDIIAARRHFENPKKTKKSSFNFMANNIDYEKLLSLVDSIKTIDGKELGQYLITLNEFWSTTTFWKSIKLINNNNEELSITSRFYDENPFCLPWSVSLNGYTVKTTNFEINRFIENIYPLFLNNQDRVYVLHSLVKKIYNSKN